MKNILFQDQKEAARLLLDQLRQKADEVVCWQEDPPGQFFAIGRFYRHFEQVSDEEAKRLLKEVERDHQ